jgi:hypothetical protein
METVLALRSEVGTLNTACDEVRQVMSTAHAQMQLELEHKVDVQRKARGAAESKCRKLELEVHHWKEEMHTLENGIASMDVLSAEAAAELLKIRQQLKARERTLKQKDGEINTLRTELVDAEWNVGTPTSVENGVSRQYEFSAPVRGGDIRSSSGYGSATSSTDGKSEWGRQQQREWRHQQQQHQQHQQQQHQHQHQHLQGSPRTLQASPRSLQGSPRSVQTAAKVGMTAHNTTGTSRAGSSDSGLATRGFQGTDCKTAFRELVSSGRKTSGQKEPRRFSTGTRKYSSPLATDAGGFGDDRGMLNPWAKD